MINNYINKNIKQFFLDEEKTWSDAKELAPGIFIFKDIIPKSSPYVLEKIIESKKNDYTFSEAQVGYGQKMKEYRDCLDFKYKKSDIISDRSNFGNMLKDLWDDIYDNSLPAVNAYCKYFNVGELRYWEAMNFVKYGVGQHFEEHHDHGYSYNCVVSLVGYPNDDYEGGEIYFTLQDLKIKPDAGDLFIFPSNYMYPHKAMPVTKGTKYSIVTMLDYSDKFHDPKFFTETGS